MGTPALKMESVDNLSRIKGEISALGWAKLLWTKKEVVHLAEILPFDEPVLGVASGHMNGSTWLITLTDRRIIFLDKGMFFGLKQIETPLEKVNSIEHTEGLLLGHISIWDGSSKMVIKNVDKSVVTPFATAVRGALNTLKNSKQGIKQSPESESSVDQILKLAELKSKGLINDEEFQQMKTKALNSK